MPAPDPDFTVTLGVDTHKVDTHKDVHAPSPSTPLAADSATSGYRPPQPDTTRSTTRPSDSATSTPSASKEPDRTAPGSPATCVIEVNRPDRATRYRKGKSDPIDADSAARAVPARHCHRHPRTGDHQVEVIRKLKLTRDPAVKAHTLAVNQFKARAVSHEAVYSYLCAMPRGKLKKLGIRLDSGRTRRRARKPLGQRKTGPIVRMRSIDERPEDVLARKVPGDWEGDFVRHEALHYRAEVEDHRRRAVRWHQQGAKQVRGCRQLLVVSSLLSR